MPILPRLRATAMPLLALVALTATTIDAAATGGFACRADDANLRLTAGSAVTRRLSGGTLNFAGRLEIRAGGVARDLRNTALTPSRLAQSWFRDRELRLSIYFERDEPHATVDLVIRTRAAGEDSYRGDYVLTVNDTTGEGTRLERRGRVTCSVE